MSFIEEYHVARKARLARLGALKPPTVYGARPTRPIVYENLAVPEFVMPDDPDSVLWCYDLVRYRLRQDTQHGVVSVPRINSAVAEEFGVTKLDMLSRRNTNDCVLPRQVAIWLCRRFTKLSVAHIGRKFERDHTTILHAIRKIDRLLPNDLALQGSVDRIKTRINL